MRQELVLGEVVGLVRECLAAAEREWRLDFKGFLEAVLAAPAALEMSVGVVKELLVLALQMIGRKGCIHITCSGREDSCRGGNVKGQGWLPLLGLPSASGFVEEGMSDEVLAACCACQKKELLRLAGQVGRL